MKQGHRRSDALARICIAFLRIAKCFPFTARMQAVEQRRAAKQTKLWAEKTSKPFIGGARPPEIKHLDITAKPYNQERCLPHVFVRNMLQSRVERLLAQHGTHVLAELIADRLPCVGRGCLSRGPAPRTFRGVRREPCSSCAPTSLPCRHS